MEREYLNNPLLCLLPKLGECAKLSQSLESFKDRLAELKASNTEELSDRSRLGEEAMLGQILSWLNVEEQIKDV